MSEHEQNGVAAAEESDGVEIFFDAEGQEVQKPNDEAARSAKRARTRARAAVSMALAGATDKEIADQLRYVTPGAARKAYETELAGAYNPDTDYEALRRLQSARHEALLKSLAPKALNAKIRVKDPDDPKGERTILVDNEEHLAYAGQFRATLGSISKLHGLDAPQVIKMQTPDQLEFMQVVAALAAAAGNSESVEGDIFADDEDIVDAEVVDDGNA